ncbi:unnamed protein product [Urochloa humidicola]
MIRCLDTDAYIAGPHDYLYSWNPTNQGLKCVSGATLISGLGFLFALINCGAMHGVTVGWWRMGTVQSRA